MNAKQREFWREQFTDAIIMAAGAAVILGRQDIAQALNRALSDIDRPAGTCYTKANQCETARKTEGKKMANWKKQREIAMNATAQQLIDSDTGENEYGYHISVIDGINIAWRYHKQTASNAYDVCYWNKAYSATHIIIEDIPNFAEYNACKSTAEFESRIIKI